MLEPRIIPCLLFQNQGLVKTINFKKPRYIGDPVNAVRIFNAKEVDEMIFLDIDSTKLNQEIRLDLIRRLAAECFMPLAYGGGIRRVSDIKAILEAGVEKVIINSAFFENPLLVKEAARKFGSQSIVVAIDVREELGQYHAYIHSGKQKTVFTVLDAAKLAQQMGAGELMVNSIDRDGAMRGYDLKLIKSVAKSVNIPIIACGGAGIVKDLKLAINAGAQAAAAGSMFVYYGARRAVLINFPSSKELELIGVR